MLALACARLAKSVQIQTLIAELPVEALEVAVLRGLARLDEIKGDAMRIRPCIHELPSELGTIVDRDLLWRAILGSELVEDADHSLAWQGRIDLNRQAFPCHDIEHVERAETAAVGEGIEHEIPDKSMAQAAPRFQTRSDGTRGVTATRLRF
jgi:hypothetical protein